MLCAIAAGSGLGAAATRAGAETTPEGVEYHALATFPVEGKVTYTDDFGDCRFGCTRQHMGNDLMGSKLQRELAVADGTISWVRDDNTGTAGNMIQLKGKDGWIYWYIHINNDTPGTDDGANPAEFKFAPGIHVGAKVKAGDFIAYMGDSGDAESTGPHLHFEMHRPDNVAIDPYASLRLSQGLAVGGQCRYASNPPSVADAAAGSGYWALGADGGVFSFGSAQFLGRPAPRAEGAAYVGLAGVSGGTGYWVTDAAGAVDAFGAAVNYGSMAGTRLNQPMIGMTPTGTGAGYWLLAQDGGIFSFGDARFYGSMGDQRLNAPIIAMASTPTGNGYWLLGADGGVFSFGDAQFWGSTGAMKLAAPVVGMAATAGGKGYWLLGRDGGIFSFGDADYRGSVPGLGRCTPPVAQAFTGTNTGKGYWVLLADGHIQSFGDASPHGEPAGGGAVAVALAVVPKG